MKKLSVFMLVGLTLLFSTTVFAAEPAPETAVDPAAVSAQVVPGAVSLVPDQDAEEVQIPAPANLDEQEYADEYLQALHENAQAKIAAIETEIEQLSDRSQEPELQKEIENLKLQEEITRLEIQLELVRDSGNQELAAELEKEIAHLETIDQPVVGTLNQPAQRQGETGIDQQEADNEN